MNKKLFLWSLLLLVLLGSVSATDYFVRVGGSDVADGLSNATAWASLAKVNSVSLSAGDVVSFRGGDVWRCPVDAYFNFDNGDAGANVTYTSYGVGRAVFLGSYDGDVAGSWSDEGGDVWLFNLTFPNPSYDDVGSMYMNGDTIFGVRKIFGLANLSSQGDFYYNQSTRRLYMFSVGSPDSVYDGLEMGWNSPIADFRWLPSAYTGNRYVDFNSLELKYTARHAIYASSGAHHIYIHNNSVVGVGGGWCGSCGGPLQYRWGNGVEVWNPASYIFVYDNFLERVWDAALTTQGDGSLNNNNTYFYNNTVKNSTYCFEHFANSAGSTTVNVSFVGNTCVDIGGFLMASEQRVDTSGPKCIRYGAQRGTASGVVVTDNLCSVLDGYYYFSSMSDWVGWENDSNLLMDYNSYFMNDTPVIYWAASGVGSYSDLASFVSAEGKEVNSIVLDPVFVNESVGDYSLYNDSSACTAGSLGSFVGAWSCVASLVAVVVPPAVADSSGCGAGEVALLGVIFLVFLVGLLFLVFGMSDNLPLGVLLALILAAVFLVVLLPVIKSLLGAVC